MKGRELRVVCIFAGARLAEGAWPRDAPLAHMHSLTTATPQRERETETETETERERERESKIRLMTTSWGNGMIVLGRRARRENARRHERCNE